VNVYALRFADDKAMLSNIAKGLQTLMLKLNDATEEYRMNINAKKTKVVCLAKKGNKKVKIIINGHEIEQVNQFRYLGSVRTEKGQCEQEIKTRIAMAKAPFNEGRTLLKRKLKLSLTKKLKKSTTHGA